MAEIILTASGGPFRNLPIEKFPEITLADALKHPTWDMGKKITIDSATMANKGLEIIEAQRIFDFDIKGDQSTDSSSKLCSLTNSNRGYGSLCSNQCSRYASSHTERPLLPGNEGSPLDLSGSCRENT